MYNACAGINKREDGSDTKDLIHLKGKKRKETHKDKETSIDTRRKSDGRIC